MDKQEFLMVLRESLSGEVPEQEVSNNIRYYDEYLVDEADKSLEEKIRELGEPRLIAKTIVDAYVANHEGTNYKSYGHDYEENYTEQAADEKINKSKLRYYSWDTMKWYQKLIALAVGLAIIAVLVSLLVLGVNVFFNFIFPVLMIVFGVKMVIRLFR